MKNGVATKGHKGDKKRLFASVFFVILCGHFSLCGRAWGLAPDSLPSLLETSAESPAIADRLHHPWNQFLLNGQTSFSAGDLFYAEQRFSSRERFSLMPEFPILPVFPENDSAFASAGANTGNEINREGIVDQTPFTRGFIRSHLTSASRIAWEGEEDDLLSSRTFPRRDSILGNRAASELAYLGDSLPPLSLWRAGAELQQRGGALRVGHARGFVWAPSLLTGENYPMKAQGTEMRVGLDEDLGMRFRYYSYDGMSAQPRDAPKATFSEVGLAVKGGSDPWIWKFEWGYRKRVIEKGSLWAPLDRASYPWAFHGGREWKGEDIPWKIRMRAGLEYDESALLSRGVVEAEEPLKKNVFSQSLRIYHRHPFDDSAFIAEARPGDLSPTVFYRVPPNGRGAALSLGYDFRDSSWEAGCGGFGSLEWEIPIFEGSAEIPGGASYWNSRRGVYRGADDVLGRGGASLHAEAKAGGHVRIRAEAGWQEFYGEEEAALEFSPAPYFGETEARCQFAHGFRAEARLQGMGAKEYRGYGISLRVPPHFENHLGLEQSFGARLKLRMALFHAFGDEILEHPLGNPLRFRVFAGLACALR